MELTINPDQTLSWDRELTEKFSLKIEASGMRRQTTGLHAQITIFINKTSLGYDTFNIGRQEDRARLAKRAYAHVKNGLLEAYPLDVLTHDVDEFCRALPAKWEEDRFELCHYDADEDVGPVEFILKPYIIDGGGTIFFAPPKSGKSYILMAMSASIGAGKNVLWTVVHRPVLYVNLERSGKSMQRRWRWLCASMGIKGKDHSVWFLHARGLPFTAVGKKIAAWMRIHPDGIGMVDSISRAGYGSLKDDDVANSIVDFLNHHFPTWGAIAHTPRGDGDHTFGSIHFDAGQDIGVKVGSDRKGNIIGVTLQVDQGNDVGIPPAQCLALEFGLQEEDGLKSIHHERLSMFPKLLLQKPKTDEDKIKAYLLEVGTGATSEISQKTGVNRSNASTLLNSCDDFIKVGRKGKEVLYAVKEVTPF